MDSQSFSLIDAYNTFDMRACELLHCLKFLSCFIFKVDLLPFSPFLFLVGGKSTIYPWDLLLICFDLFAKSARPWRNDSIQFTILSSTVSNLEFNFLFFILLSVLYF